jgi:hypothetical protein
LTWAFHVQYFHRGRRFVSPGTQSVQTFFFIQPEAPKNFYKSIPQLR